MTALSLLRPSPPSLTRPTRYSQLVFGAKAVILRARRTARNLVAGPPPLAKADGLGQLVLEVSWRMLRREPTWTRR